MSNDITVRYQLLRAKSSDYKAGGTPSLVEVETTNDSGKKENKSVQEMEIIDIDFPLCMPIILYNQDKYRLVDAGQPFLVYNNELYAIYNFTQLEIDKNNEIVVNIWVMYVAPANNSQLAKRK